MRVPEILRICQGKTTLHLGCADMPKLLQSADDLLHLKLADVTDHDNLWGLDSSEEGCQILRKMGFDKIIHGNVENIDETVLKETFDIILAGEIIEHLSDPGIFIRNLTPLMKDKTKLIVTTPNAHSFQGFLHAMVRREKVHYDHNFYFSYQTLGHLLESCGLRCIDIYYYQDTGKKGIPRFFNKAISIVTKISHAWADGLIVCAVSSNHFSQAESETRAQ